MLSVLIPIYNFEMAELVTDLQLQCQKVGVECEIICIDDCSDAKFHALNAPLDKLEGVRYRQLSQNVGRSRIRNLLAKEAQMEWLLFLDCDSKLPDDNFIRRYIQHFNTPKVLCGGTIYGKNPPVESTYFLHWLYGSHREARPAAERMSDGLMGFASNNFALPADLFHQIRFDEDLTQYGHEDTLFGIQVRKRQIDILHIDNPVEHLGLEPNEVFLRKHRMAIENLLKVQQSHPELQTRLSMTYQRLQSWGLAPLLRWFHRLLGPSLQRKLARGQTQLFWLDIYRLGEWSLLLQRASGPTQKPL
ncbi:MAG: glycosyltransferase [Bacteroidota bacterium]